MKPRNRITATEGLGVLELDAWTNSGVKLIQVNHIFLSASKHFYAKNHVSISQFILMQLIKTFPGITTSRIKAVIGIPVGSLSLMINKLIDQKLVLRTSDQNDARRFRLYLSRSGACVVSRATDEYNKTVQRILNKLGENNHETSIYSTINK